VNIFAPLGSTPDARLASGSIASAGASFTNPKFFSVAAPTVATNSFTYCQGATATQLSATASNGNTLTWYDVAIGGTALTGTPTPSTTASGTYTYYVSQKNTNGDESPRVAIVVTVNALPATPTISANGATSFCTGGNVELTSSSATGNVWSTNATTQAITVTTSGSYSVTVTDNNGCSASSSATTVNVSNAPIPTVTASATQACSGDVVTLTASNSDSYSWSNGASTQSIQVTNTGSYTVTTTNADACDGAGASDAVTVTFTATPTAAGSFTTNGNIVTFTNASTGASSYSWDFGDFTNSSATSPVHAYAVNNSYQVVLTAINGICSDTATFNVSITLSVEEIMGISNLVIYPNPASNDVFISFDNQSGNAMSIELVDQLGRVVYSSSEIQIIGFNTIALNSSNVSDGMYSVRLQSGNNSITKRIIIRK
jgi:PKD repeat protein